MKRLGEPLVDSANAFRGVFRNRDLRRLQLAWAGSMIGTWAYGIALVVFAYEAGGARAVGIVGFARWTAAALAAPFAGVAGDRFPRVRVMVATDVIRAAALVAAAAAAFTDSPELIVYVLAGVVSVTGTAFRPAQAALVPSLARTPEELTAANVTATTIESVGIFLGPALGGLLLAATSTGVVFLVTAATFLWSALLLRGIRPPAAAQRDETDEGRREPIGSAVIVGFRVIARERRLRVLVGLFAAQTFVVGALNVLVVVASLELLDLGNAGVGFLNSALGIGGLVGALAAAALVSRGRLAAIFGLGILLWGVPIALIGAWPVAVVALLLFGCVGVGNTIVDVAGMTLLQRSAEEHVLARLFGVLESLIVGSIGLGAAAAPILIALLGNRGAFIATGLVLPALVLLTWPRLAEIDRAAAVPVRELELLRAIPLFAPLPPATIESLASQLRPVQKPERSEVLRRGEHGDRFYVIDSGEVEVSADGKPPAVLGPGDYFGEIALLRGVPRTATVVARTDVRLLALDGDAFVSTVSGHAESREAANTVIRGRLAPIVPV